MRLLAEFFPEFTEKLDDIDKLYEDKRSIDEKTYVLLQRDVAKILEDAQSILT